MSRTVRKRRRNRAAVSVAERRIWQFIMVCICAALVWGIGGHNVQALLQVEKEDACEAVYPPEVLAAWRAEIAQLEEEEQAAKIYAASAEACDGSEEVVLRRAVCPGDFGREEEHGWLHEFFACLLLPQLRYPFFLAPIVFLVTRMLAKKYAQENDAADLPLMATAVLALFGGVIFYSARRESPLLILAGLLVISSALLAGLVYVKLREGKWVAAALPFTVLAFEVVSLIGRAHSFWDAMY